MVPEDFVIKPARVARPDPARLGAGFAWLLVAVVFGFRFAGVTRLIVVGVDVVLGAATLWVLTKARKDSSLCWRDGLLTYRGLCSEKRLRVDRSWRVEMVDLAGGQSTGMLSRMWLLLDATGRARLALNPAAWNLSDLDAIAAMLAIEVEVAPRAKRLAQIREDYPGALPTWAAYPILTGSAVVLALILVAVVITVV